MPLDIIGAGLGRTGTMSLKLALEQLGFVKCYHMVEVLHNTDFKSLWLEAAEGNPDWEAIFDGYRATVDYPGCSFWRELADVYPEAKVLLSVRDPDSWFESTQASIFSQRLRERVSDAETKAFLAQTVYSDLGDRITDRAFMTDYFRRRTEEIEAAIPADRLLVYEVKQGWEPLCVFLGVPVPDVPFPRTNSREEFQAMLAAMEAAGGDPFSGNAGEEVTKALTSD